MQKRRDFIKSIIIGGVVVTASTLTNCSLNNDNNSNKNKPNILIYMPDGMQKSPLDPGHICQTPNFDRIAKMGVRFENAYTPNPTSSPARASLMTGLLPHNHGVLQVYHCVDDDQSVLRKDKPHWAQQLTTAGYKTGYFGKWHIEESSPLNEFGWQESFSKLSIENDEYNKIQDSLPERELDPEFTHYIKGPKGYYDFLQYGVTDIAPEKRHVSVPVNMAIPFLDEALKGDEPWCCCVSSGTPNESLVCGREAFDLYNNEDLELPKNLNDKFENGPNFYKREQGIFNGFSEKVWRETLACYYGRITESDAQFGRLLDKLEQSGELENTIIIITTDHGRYVGEHGMDGHNFGPFEAIYNIPLIISGPGIVKDNITSARVGLHDLCPTILELANAEPIDVPDSKSFASILKTPETAQQNFTTGFAENHGTRYPLMQRVYWDGPWKMIFNGFDFDELYNTEEDPLELNNLANLPQYKEKVESLMTKMWKIINETNDKSLIGTHYLTMRFGAVGPVPE